MLLNSSDMKVLYENEKQKREEEYIKTRESRIENYLKEYDCVNFEKLTNILKTEGRYKFSLPVKSKYMYMWKHIAEEIDNFFSEKGYYVSTRRNNNPNRKWVSYWIEIYVI